MSDPFSLFMLKGLGGVYVLISSFYGACDGEKYIYNLEHANLAK